MITGTEESQDWPSAVCRPGKLAVYFSLGLKPGDQGACVVNPSPRAGDELDVPAQQAE